MILSTTELKPKASIAGIQAKSWEPQRVPPEAQVKTVDSREAHEVGESFELPKVPSVINPLNPTQILLAVLSSQLSSFGSASGLGSPYLQTFDFATAHHISRQALARTNVSSLNVGPEANKIGEPNIDLMSISIDGKWLASVDEWNPPKRDINFLCLDKEGLVQEQNRQREVYLKFWSWSEESKMWELVTRVDAPHFSSTRDNLIGAGRITDMAADPSGLGFATIGVDGSVKLWRPRKRTRDGVVLRGRDSKVLVSWGCYQVVQIGSRGRAADFFGDHLILKDEYPASPCLAYSTDGSVIAASYPGNSDQGHSAVHLIDTASGEIHHVRDGVQTGGIVAIGMVGPYAILLGETLIVWDMVQDTLQYGVKLRLPSLSFKQKASMVRLAVDQYNNTFAIAVPVVESKERGERAQSFPEKAHSQVMVFDPAVPNPLFSVSIPNLVTALLPAVGSKGYAVLDLAAELRLISATGSSFAYDSAIIGQETLLDELKMASIEDATGGREDNNGVSDDEEQSQLWLPLQSTTVAYDDDDSPPVIRQEQLAEIFDVGPSFAPPPVNELFEKVVGLFARRPILRDPPSA
jgi:NET1-associated nuclear protein 1 (U3 small nucleolar RNA-associated protein 17)